MKTMKKWLGLLGSLALVIGTTPSMPVIQAAPNASVDRATNVDNLMLDQNGIYDSGGTLRFSLGSTTSFTGNFTVSGNETISAGSDLVFGSASTAVSTTTTSGSSQGSIFTAYLGGSTAASEGSVLIATTTNSNNSVTVVVAPATNFLSSVVGIAAAAASTGSVVNVYDTGWVLALTTGTVNPGDTLTTSSLSAGYLATFSGVNSTNTVVGIALGPGASGGGTTKIKIK